MTSDQIRAVGEVISRSLEAFSGLVVRARHDLSVTFAWGLITWGVFGLSARAWAVSVGIYFFASAILAAIAGAKNVRK